MGGFAGLVRSEGLWGMSRQIEEHGFDPGTTTFYGPGLEFESMDFCPSKSTVARMHMTFLHITLELQSKHIRAPLSFRPCPPWRFAAPLVGRRAGTRQIGCMVGYEGGGGANGEGVIEYNEG